MNKTYLTVAQVFALISGIAFLLLFMAIITIPLGVLNIVAFNVLGKAKKGIVDKDKVRNWSIYLIFTSLIGGIFGLLAVESDEPSSSTSLEQQLIELNRLYDNNLITKEEYDIRRKKIIEKD